jgi:tellurite resistance protein
MTDADILKSLNRLGIDEASHRVLALLPLVQVAWADGAIQAEERQLIVKVARERYHLTAEGTVVLEDWLRYAPTTAYLTLGRQVLLELVRKNRDRSAIDDVVVLAHEVARAAGGLFGLAKIDASERQALAEIAAALSIPEGHDWRRSFSQCDEETEEADEEDVDDEPTDVRSVEEMAALAVAVAAVLDDAAPASTLDHGVLLRLDGLRRPYPVLGELKIGRHGLNHVVIADDGQVSRFHATITASAGRFTLVDHGATNGTAVNGQLVSQRRLFGGEEIVIGTTIFFFQLGPYEPGDPSR